MKYYSDTEKEWNPAIRGNMDEPRDCHTEWSKLNTERKSHMILLITYVWTLKKWGTYEITYKTEIVTDVENTLMVTSREEGEG